MGEILPRHYIIGVIMFTLLITAGIAMLTELNNSDQTFVDDDKFSSFKEHFNKTNEITTQVGALQTGVTDAEPGQDYEVSGVLGALIASGWNTLQLLFGSFSFMNDAFQGFHDVFGVPAWVGELVILLITVIFVFAIYTAVFQREI